MSIHFGYRQHLSVRSNTPPKNPFNTSLSGHPFNVGTPVANIGHEGKEEDGITV
jgi:hypothetical protein